MGMVIIYGPGGYDPTKPNNNIIEQASFPDPPAPVPEDASPATIRVALRRLHGVSNAALDNTVSAVIDSLFGDERDDAETLWLYSVSIRRDHPLVAAVGQALNLTNDQIDEVFRVAATI